MTFMGPQGINWICRPCICCFCSFILYIFLLIEKIIITQIGCMSFVYSFSPFTVCTLVDFYTLWYIYRNKKEQVEWCICSYMLAGCWSTSIFIIFVPVCFVKLCSCIQVYGTYMLEKRKKPKIYCFSFCNNQRALSKLPNQKYLWA